MNLPTIPHDKANHFIYGAVGGAGAAQIAALIGFHAWGPVIAIEAAVLMGIAGELSDHFHNRQAASTGQPITHEVSPQDFLATLLGGLFVGWVLLI